MLRSCLAVALAMVLVALCPSPSRSDTLVAQEAMSEWREAQTWAN